MNSLATLTTLFYFSTLNIIFMATLTTLFYFSTIKMKYLTTLITLFYFTTTNCRDRATLTALLLSLIHQMEKPQGFQCFHEICICHSNFTVRKFSEVLHALPPTFFNYRNSSYSPHRQNVYGKINFPQNFRDFYTYLHKLLSRDCQILLFKNVYSAKNFSETTSNFFS